MLSIPLNLSKKRSLTMPFQYKQFHLIDCCVIHHLHPQHTITVTYVYEKEKLPIADEPINTDKPLKSPNTGADYSVFTVATVIIFILIDTIIILFFKYQRKQPERFAIQ